MDEKSIESILSELEADGFIIIGGIRKEEPKKELKIIGGVRKEETEKELEKKVKTMTHDYTRGNSDNVGVAVLGLDIFSKSWCMNCEETEEKGEPMFRCGKCPFRGKGGTCSVKEFVVQNKPGALTTGTVFGSMSI